MNRFRTKKKTKEEAPPRVSHDSDSSAPFRLFGKNKKTTEEEPKKEIDLATALPSSDDFRTSLLMTGLSARFSMLKEQDDPTSKIGKASDDSVLFPKRQSRMLDFGFGPGLGDIAEVESIRGKAPFARMDSFHSSEGSTSGSIMDRAKPVDGNNLFGGRQKIYKLPSGGASTKNLDGGMSGRALYGDDVAMSSFQRWRQSEKDRQPSADERQDQVNLSIDIPRAESPPAADVHRKRETNSSMSSAPSVGRNSTAATSVTSQPNAMSKDWQSTGASSHSSAATPALERSVTRTRRLYETGLLNDLHEQQNSALSRMDTLSRQRNLGSRTPDMSNAPSPTTGLFTDRFGDRKLLAKASAPNLRSMSPPMTTSSMGTLDFGTRVPSIPESKTAFGNNVAAPLSPPISETEERSPLNIQPNDLGKATSMGVFNKPGQQYDETNMYGQYDPNGMSDLSISSNPWDSQSPDWQSSYFDSSQSKLDSRINTIEERPKQERGEDAMPAPSDAKLRSETRHAEEKEDDFARHLADGARRVRERLTSYVESDSRSVSPQPSEREPMPSRSNPLHLLISKSSRGSLVDRSREREQVPPPPKVNKMLGIGASTMSSSPSPSKRSFDFESKDPLSPMEEEPEKASPSKQEQQQSIDETAASTPQSACNLRVQPQHRGGYDSSQASPVSPMAPMPSPLMNPSAQAPPVQLPRRPSAPPTPNLEGGGFHKLDESTKRAVRKRDISEPTFVSSTSRVPTVNLPEEARSRSGSRSGTRSRSGSLLATASTPNLHALANNPAHAPPLPPINPKRRNMLGFRGGRKAEDEMAGDSPQMPFAPHHAIHLQNDGNSAFSISDEDEGGARDRRRLRKATSEANGMNCRATLPPSLSPFPHALRLAPYIWTHPYTLLSSSTCYVLDDGNGRAVGYCIGCPDVKAFGAVYGRYVKEVLEPSTEVEAPRSRDFREPWAINGEVNEQALLQLAHDFDMAVLQGKEILWETHRATMHIDLLEEWQAKGWGRKLVEAFVESLREQKGYEQGIHIGIAGDNGKVVAFYEKVGFRLQPGGEKWGGFWMLKDLE
ncbi:hypothetical protein ACHAPB_005457 [Verticillium nonalfalfae]